MEEKLYFQNSKGNKLCGILLNPTGDKNKLVVILVHGFHSSKDSGSWLTLKEELKNKNISSFRFDVFGHGESEGLFEDVTISEAVDDILKAIEFLRGLGYTKIALAGSSFGGIASIMAASKTNTLSFLVLKCPVSEYNEKEFLTHREEFEKWKQTGYKTYYDEEGKEIYRVKFSFYEDAKYNNGYEAAPKIKVPTLIVHGDADRTVPISQSIKTSKLISNCELKVVHGADHRFERPEEFKQMINAIVDFIVKHSQ